MPTSMPAIRPRRMVGRMASSCPGSNAAGALSLPLLPEIFLGRTRRISADSGDPVARRRPAGGRGCRSRNVPGAGDEREVREPVGRGLRPLAGDGAGAVDPLQHRGRRGFRERVRPARPFTGEAHLAAVARCRARRSGRRGRRSPRWPKIAVPSTPPSMWPAIERGAARARDRAAAVPERLLPDRVVARTFGRVHRVVLRDADAQHRSVDPELRDLEAAAAPSPGRRGGRAPVLVSAPGTNGAAAGVSAATRRRVARGRGVGARRRLDRCERPPHAVDAAAISAIVTTPPMSSRRHRATCELGSTRQARGRVGSIVPPSAAVPNRPAISAANHGKLEPCNGAATGTRRAGDAGNAGATGRCAGQCRCAAAGNGRAGTATGQWSVPCRRRVPSLPSAAAGHRRAVVVGSARERRRACVERARRVG